MSVQSAVVNPFFPQGFVTTPAHRLTATPQGSACTGGQPGPTTDDGWVQANLSSPITFYNTS